ncbi:MAG: cytochrome P450, partial [Anaerolineales bacterium]|nr:cytochrome P450 [Anaerolineales bacterium]
MTSALNLESQKDIPGPSPVPILGWLPGIIKFAFQPLSTLEAIREKYGNMVRLGFGKYPAVMVFDPEYHRQILRDPNSFYAYDLDLVPVNFPEGSSIRTVTTGMPLMNGERHNDHRSALLPYFHKKFITRYHEACVEVTHRKIADWNIGEEVDMRAEMERLAIWIATAPVLGLDPEKEGEAIGLHLERTMKILFNPFTLLFPYDIRGLPFHSLMKNADEMERIVRGVVASKKEEGLTGDDILSIMIQMHEEDPERMSEAELLGHTTTMFRGGYNPNGMALYWTIFLLTQHPEALKNVLAELDQVMVGKEPTPESVEKLPWLEGAIKEAMRLFPAGTWTGRLAMRDFELDSHPLPKGTWVVMSPYVIHRVPDIFPDPHRFKPERWQSEYHTAYEFMPFSAGPRYCIGTSLGMLQLKIALSIILRRFSFTLKPGVSV